MAETRWILKTAGRISFLGFIPFGLGVIFIQT
jgi:hypothetical protein